MAESYVNLRSQRSSLELGLSPTSSSDAQGSSPRRGLDPDLKADEAGQNVQHGNPEHVCVATLMGRVFLSLCCSAREGAVPEEYPIDYRVLEGILSSSPALRY